MNLLKLFFLPLCIFMYLTADAHGWSYIYIQGDKQIPFYVKLEGEMLPRYSKNYYIIPQLEAGPVHLQVLFQQNEYPAQNFTVLVPEGGARGFLLSRKDNTFALYDVQQRFYLYSGDNGEDHLPEMISVKARETKPDPLPKTKNTNGQPEKAISKSGKDKTKTSSLTQAEKTTANEPQFLEDVVLENDHIAAPEQPTPELTETSPETPAEDIQPEQESTRRQQPDNSNDQQPVVQEQITELAGNDTKDARTDQQEQIEIESNTAPVINSDCPQPLDDAEFDKIYSTTKDKSDDEKRVSYLMKKAESNCFTSRQAYFLAREMTAESMRYSFLKKAYPRITDQQNFYLLEDHLFRTLEWKSYFRLIYQ